jgi:hypothetical protein
MAQQEYVIDILQPTDPALAELVPIRQVARYWKAEEEFARRILQAHGVHLVKVEYPLMVRWTDVREFEKAHTIILGSKSDSKPRRKEVVASF